ncbi:MAG: hypothetical protein PUC30_11690 [Lachnospiraceae bacterium]|nr:hypothetical protein [Lachnospiraceae bacterium]
MALVPAICTQCGAHIEVDNTHDAGICNCCGTAFVTEKVINRYNTYITNNNNFSGANINIVNEDVNAEIQNIQNLINIGKLYDAEKILKNLSIRYSGNIQVWNTYAMLSYKKYIEEENYENYREECKCLKFLTPPLDFNARCQTCLDKLKEYKKNCGQKSSSEIDDLLEKVKKIKEKSDKEIVEYLYRTPKCFCFDFFCGDGCFPIFTWTDAKGNNFIVKSSTIGVIQDFINDCKKNMDIYDNAIKSNRRLTDYKLVYYLCGEHLAESLSKSGSWKVVGFNGYTLIVKKYCSDAYDNKREVYSTNILIQKNVESILLEACKIEPRNGCYIATCVYGSYDCSEVWTLRRFRDYILDSTWYGRAFIKCYYAISPSVVKVFGKMTWFRSFWKHILDAWVANLNSNGIEGTEYRDKY